MVYILPSALSIHQLAAQGEVSEVAAHLSKGEEARPWVAEWTVVL